MPYKVQLTVPDGDDFHIMGTKVLATLDPIRLSAEIGLNRVGQASIEIAKSDWVFDPLLVPSNWYGLTPPAAIQLWVIRLDPRNGNHAPVWGGLLQEAQTQAGSGTITLAADEFVGWYDRILLTTAFPDNSSSQFAHEIVRKLLVIESGPGMRMEMIGTTSLQVHSPQWHEWQDLKILELIRRMSQLTQPFEWRQNLVPGGSVYAPTLAPGLWAAVFDIRHPRIGADLGYDRVVAWGEGTPHNAESMRYSFSSANTATQLKVKGAGERGTQRRRMVNASEYMGQPRYDDVFVDDQLITQEAVDRRAVDLVGVRSIPQLAVSARLRTYGPEDLQKTEPNALWDWSYIDIGDRIRTSIRDSGLSYDAYLRITRKAVSLETGNNEFLDVELTPDSDSYSLFVAKTAALNVSTGLSLVSIDNLTMSSPGVATVDWGDGTTTTVSSGGSTSHTYGSVYTGPVKITHPASYDVTELEISGGWNFDVLDLKQFPQLLRFVAGSGNYVYGAVHTLPPLIEHVDIQGNNYVSGVVSWMPGSLQYFKATGAAFANVTAGNAMPQNLTTFHYVGGFNFSQTGVDAILQGLVNNNQVNGTLYLPAPNVAPSATGLTLKTTLQSRGWTVTTA